VDTEKNAAGETLEDLWGRWKASGFTNQSVASEICRHPIFKRWLSAKIAVYAGRTPIQQSALEQELVIGALRELPKYDPALGFKVTTFLDNQVRLNRMVTNNQNFSRITEGRAQQIGNVARAQGTLTDELSRTPTHKEIADFINLGHVQQGTKKRVTAADVEKVIQEQRRDLISSKFETGLEHERGSRMAEVIALLPPSLTPRQLEVFNHVYGLNGYKKTDKTGEIAKLTKMSPSQVSTIRAAIGRMVDRYASM